MNSNRIRMLFYHHYISGIKQSFTSTQSEGRGWLAFCTVACLLVISWTSCLAGAEALTTIMTICDKLLSSNTSMFLDPVGKHDSSLYTIQLLHYYPHLAWIQNNYSLLWREYSSLTESGDFLAHWAEEHILSMADANRISVFALQQSASDLLRVWGSNSVASSILKNQTQRSYWVKQRWKATKYSDLSLYISTTPRCFELHIHISIWCSFILLLYFTFRLAAQRIVSQLCGSHRGATLQTCQDLVKHDTFLWIQLASCI